jgi:hypothetical protein
VVLQAMNDWVESICANEFGPADSIPDHRCKYCVVLVKRAISITSILDAPQLLGLSIGKDKLWRYSNNDAAQTRKGKRKLAKSISRVPIAEPICQQIERDILSTYNQWGEQEKKRFLVHDIEPLAVESDDLEEKVVPLVTVDLGECSKFAGLFVDILDFGIDFPCDFPAAKRSAWCYTTVVEGSEQLIVEIPPNIAGRITFKRGALANKTVEWRVSMVTDKTTTRVGLPGYSAWITEPSRLNLISRKQVAWMCSSATTMWDEVYKAVGSSTGPHIGPEWLGLHHPQLVALLDSRCKFDMNDSPGADKLTSDQRFATPLTMVQLGERQAACTVAAASDSLIQSMNVFCPGDPVNLFRRVLQYPNIRRTFKLDKPLTHQEIFDLPFVRTLLAQYHKHPGNPTIQIPILSSFAFDLKTFSRQFLMDKFQCTNRRLRFKRSFIMPFLFDKPNNLIFLKSVLEVD